MEQAASLICSKLTSFIHMYIQRIHNGQVAGFKHCITYKCIPQQLKIAISFYVHCKRNLVMVSIVALLYKHIGHGEEKHMLNKHVNAKCEHPSLLALM